MLFLGLRYLWASPNTLVGLLFVGIGRLSGGQVRWHSGVLEVCGGFPAWFLRHATLIPGGVGAMTLGHVVMGLHQRALDETRVHERVHVEQYGRWGPFFLPAYGLSSVFALMNGGDAYRDNHFERVAYRIEREHRELRRREHLT